MQRKKQKIETQTVVLPPHYTECQPEYLIRLIVDMFNKLLQYNDNIPVTLANITRFHSRSPPGISIQDYLTRIFKYTIVEKSVLIMLLVFVDRMCKLYPNFTISSLTAHRFIIASVTASCKYISDVYSTNSFFAKVGGISLSELNIIELEFCKVLDWRLACSESTIQSYYLNLANSNPAFTLDPQPIPAVIRDTVDKHLDTASL